MTDPTSPSGGDQNWWHNDPSGDPPAAPADAPSGGWRKPHQDSPSDAQPGDPLQQAGTAPSDPAPAGQSPGTSAQPGPDQQPPYGQSQGGPAPYGQGPAGQPSHGQGLGAPSSYGQGATGQSQHGPGPSGQSPYGQGPAAQPPYGQGPAAQPPYGQGPAAQPPYGQGPAAQPPYGQGATEQAPYGQVPFGQPRQVPPYRPDDTRPLFAPDGTNAAPYGGQHPSGQGFAPGQVQPGFPGGPQYPGGPHPGGPLPGGPGPGNPSRKRAWILGGAAALVVALVAGGAVAVTNRDSEVPVTDASSQASESGPTAPIPTGSFTDGLSSTAPTPSKQAPAERKRTQADVDRGLLIYDDVYIQPAKGWRKTRKTKTVIWLTARGKGIVVAEVDPFGVNASTAVQQMVASEIKGDKMVGVRKGPVRKLKPSNSNIASEAEMNFSGRVRVNGVSISLAGKCRTMTGVESIHNVTVSVCAVALKADYQPTFKDAVKMAASVARSI